VLLNLLQNLLDLLERCFALSIIVWLCIDATANTLTQKKQLLSFDEKLAL